MASQTVLESTKSFIEKVRQQGIPVEAAYLFGSWAQGRASEWSDIDVAIVSPVFGGISFYDRQKLYRAVLAVDSGIETHPYRPEDFNDTDPFVREILRTGIRIA
jgi:predicted nucleotidyltransferase